MSNSAFSALITATGTANEIDVTAGLYPIYSISNNPIVPGNGSITIPNGTTGQRILHLGALRLNTTTGFFEGSTDGTTWVNLAVGGGGIASVSGTAGQIDVTAGVNPVISIDPAYVGQASITTLGTITTGVWNGTPITEAHGGTNQTTYILGDTLYASAANTLNKLAGNTTAVKQYLSQTGTGAVSAAPVWATVSGGDITGAALTKADDTNVTLTLGGTPATALLRAASITAGWTGQLALTRGGTNASLVASNGGIVWSNATQMQILAGTATANQLLLSGSSATPSWSTSTYPATNAINTLLYASAANTMAALATANNGVLITSAGGAPSISSTLPSAVQTNITAVGALAAGSLAAGFTPVTVPLGGTGNTTFTAYSVICAGTTATGTFQNVVGVGTAGYVLTSNGAAALPTWQVPGAGSPGSIIQVVQGTLTSAATSSSSTFADTGITATITPAANTHKILVMAMVNTGNNAAADNSTYLNLVRTASNIFVGDAAGSRIQVTAFPGAGGTTSAACSTLVYLDSPATTSATTYKVQFAASNNAVAVTINTSNLDSNAVTIGRAASSIILMEVVA